MNKGDASSDEMIERLRNINILVQIEKQRVSVEVRFENYIFGVL